MIASNGFGLKQALANAAGIGAFWFATGSVATLELAARAKPGAVVLDLQHGLWSRGGLENAVAAIPPGIPSIVRVAECSARAISEALDAGAGAVLVPLVETAEQARAAVAFSRYPPEGIRSGGGVRPVGAGFVDYVARARDGVAVGVMIETAIGVVNAAAIAATPGIDFVFIGTGDLALSLGTFPEPSPRFEESCRRVLEACRGASVPCGIFTTGPEAAAERLGQGYRLAVVANDIDAIGGSFAQAAGAFETSRKRRNAAGGAAVRGTEGVGMSSEILQRFADAVRSGGIRVVDLTQTLRPSTPTIALPPPFAPSNPFSIQEISKYDERGPAWYWNNLAMGEHTGTHFDAPVHWVTGQQRQDGFTDTIPVQRFVAPACVVDCSRAAAENEDFLLEPAHLEEWEAQHGRIPAGAWVLMRTDWSKRQDPAAFLNMRDDGAHVPGPSAAAVRFLVEQRDVNGWGVEAVGTDAGQAFAFEPAFPAHNVMHGAGKFGLASLCNLDQLPPTGALLITAPLKIERGSGSPLRVLALVPR